MKFQYQSQLYCFFFSIPNQKSPEPFPFAFVRHETIGIRNLTLGLFNYKYTQLDASINLIVFMLSVNNVKLRMCTLCPKKLHAAKQGRKTWVMWSLSDSLSSSTHYVAVCPPSSHPSIYLSSETYQLAVTVFFPSLCFIKVQNSYSSVWPLWSMCRSAFVCVVKFQLSY